jgi:hypothetical protein
MRMGEGISWIAQTFKLFDVLINPWRSPQPDPPLAPPSSEGLTPAAPADNLAASSLRVELASKLKLRRTNRSKVHRANGMMKVVGSS